MEELIKQQGSSAKNFESNYTSFKKTPLDRRTPELFSEHRRRIKSFWDQFTSIDRDIKTETGYEASHYKTSRYFETVGELRIKYENRIQQFETEYIKQQQKHQPTTVGTSNSIPSTGNSTPITSGSTNSKTTPLQQSTPKANESTAIQRDNSIATASGINSAKEIPDQTKPSDHRNSTTEEGNTSQSKGHSTRSSSKNDNEDSNGSEMADFLKERNKRSLKITQLGELVGKIETFVNENKSIQFLDQKMKQIGVLWTSILENTETMMGSDQYVKEHQDELSTVQDIYDNAVIQIEEIKASNTKKRSIKLPQLNIPHFDGNYMAWQSFHDLFEQAVYKDGSISAVEKLQLLKTVIKGEASQIIKHLQITEENFAAAWNLLKSRYNNERRLVETYVKSMLNQPRISTESAASLKKLHDTTLECFLAIKNLKIETNGSDYLLNIIIMQKLDPETIRLYETALAEPRKVQKFDDLLNFLEERFLTLDTIEGEQQGRNNGNNRGNEKRMFLINNGTLKCVACGDQHFTHGCEKFKKLTPNERYKVIQSNGACLNCLHPIHQRRDCKSRHKCSKCQKNHHTLLHFDNKNSNGDSKVVAMTQDFSDTVLLATAIIFCYSSNGDRFIMRAMIDQGSMATVITERAAQLLRAARKPIQIPLKAVGDKTAATSRQFIELQFSAAIQNARERFQIGALIMNKITQNLPVKQFDINENWTHLNKLRLADPKYNIPANVDILLGGDIWNEIVSHGLKLSKNGSPVAQRTKLGWILNGKIDEPANHLSCFSIISEGVEESIDNQLQKFWETEELQEVKTPSDEENLCEKFYGETTIRNPSGNYTVRLPFSVENPILGRSRNIAIAQLLSMERKFRLNPELKQQYIENLSEYFQNNHIEEVNTTEHQNRKMINGIETYTCAYLPHHAVIKTSSTTTKCRIVFNASRPTTNGKSLNEQLLTGPTIQDDILTILSRWRNYNFVITGDIARMYRQIRMHADDAEYQRIVWRETEEEPIRDYKLTTVTFGTTSAPFSAIRTINQNADDEKNDFPEAAVAAKRDFYVDNFYSGADTLKETINLRRQTTGMLNKAGFQIREWFSNDFGALDGVPESDRGVRQLEFNNDDTVKTLGLRWNPITDSFSYKTAQIATSDEIPTKRQFLSNTAKIYDPMGWLGPTTILIKILYQQLWINKVQWDEKIPDHINKVYQQYRIEFPLLEKIQIPRWNNITSTSKNVQLHGFCDASNDAFAAQIYIRTVDEENNVYVTLVAAKTRVVPVKQRATIPKLELNAAVLLAKLFEKLRDTIMVNYRCIAWSDSTIALSWIRNTTTKLPAFVSNRVQLIQAQNLEWRYVPTDTNPADCASRGLTPSQLLDHSLWWKGPDFLRKPESEWPQNLVPNANVNDEANGAHVFSIITGNDKIWPLEKYSSFSKLQRVVAYCKRFIQILKTKKKVIGPLTVNEMESATISIIKQTQEETFFDEFVTLRKERNVQGDLAPLNPFLDDNGIIRVNGRISRSNLPYHQKYPMILPRNHHITFLLITLAHITTLHGGAMLTLGYIRNKFWIPRGMNTIKKQVRNCQRCARFNARPMTQKMASLPEPRVNISRPFTHTGIDYAGPIDIRTSSGRGHKTTKGYISIFVCLATKSIHIEAVSNLTSTAFLAAFRRFCGRRGQPKHLYSDNGTNFVGANRMIKSLERRERESFDLDVQKTFLENGITWHFNPPAAPHFGGLWEAGVKSIKTHLNKLGQTNFTFEEFSTLLCQIESCLNSRPLCPISDDPSDLEFLTPGHFLIGTSLLAPPDERMNDLDELPLTRWQIIQKQVHLFWNKWQGEYLQRLQQRPKWLKQRTNLEINDLVLIKSDNAPPSRWLRGRVIKVYPGENDEVRVAMLKTINGDVKRPIAKLVLMPKITQPDSNKQTSNMEKAVVGGKNKRGGRQRKKYTASKTYNLRPRLSAVNIALLFLIGLITQILGAPFEVTTFSDQPGIYFEQTGDVRFINGEWTILVHYNLSAYFQLRQQHEKSIEKMDGICKTLNFISHSTPPTCVGVIKQFNEKIEELRAGDRFIRATQNHDSRRRKRSPFDFIGMIASEAFGVLDQRYAKQYAEDIEKLNDDSSHMTTLLEKHTSILQATNKAIHHNENQTKLHFETIEGNLNMVKEAINNATLDISEQKRHQVFLDTAVQTIISVMRVETMQQNIIDIITDTKHGKLNPIVFPPEVAMSQIALIKNHLSTDLSVPNEGGLGEFYSTMRVRSRTLAEMIIFEIKFPLQSNMKFQLFKVQPVPTPFENSFIFIQPTTDYLIINLQRDLFYPLPDIELLRCKQRRIGYFACQQKHALYKTRSELCKCELNLLKHQGMSKCNVKRMNATELWAQLTTTNKWLFVARRPLTIDIICSGQIFTQRLEGAGYIQFKQQCTIEREEFVLQTSKAVMSQLNASFTPQFNIAHEIMEPTNLLKFNQFNIDRNSDLQIMDNEIENLHNINKIGTKHHVHHYAVSYGTAICIIGIFIYLKYKLRLRLPRLRTGTEAPTPTERSRPVNVVAEAAE